MIERYRVFIMIERYRVVRGIAFIFRIAIILNGAQETIKYVSSRVGNSLSMGSRIPWRTLATTIKSVG